MVNIIIGGSEETEFYDHSKDRYSQEAGRVSAESYENSPFILAKRLGEGHRGDRMEHIRNRFRHVLNIRSSYADGVGTKVIPHAASRMHHIAAYDLAAMTFDDAIAKGDYPISLSNVLDARDVGEDPESFIKMMKEMGVIGQNHEVVLFTGETANLGPCISTPDKHSESAFNWSGFVNAVKHPLMHYHGKNKTNFGKVEPGNIVVALKQGGFRSNGISAVRRAFEAKFGPNWYREAPAEKFNDAFQASVIYSRAVGEALGWFNVFPSHNIKASDFEPQVDIRAIAHLSGGSMKGKFDEAILKPRNLGAILHHLYATPEIEKDFFRWQQMIPEKLKRKADVTTLQQAYETFCSGQGMLVVVRDVDQAEKLIRILEANHVDGQIAGEITDGKKSGRHLEISGDQISLD